MAYQTKEEILRVVNDFEVGTISRADWGHNEHLLVAAFYAYHNEFETALAKMRTGIFNLLHAFKVDLTMEMPYHETLTFFWMRTVFDVLNNCPNASFVEFTKQVLVIGADKDLPLKFYSRELLFSDTARKNYVAGDLSTTV